MPALSPEQLSVLLCRREIIRNDSMTARPRDWLDDDLDHSADAENARMRLERRFRFRDIGPSPREMALREAAADELFQFASIADVSPRAPAEDVITRELREPTADEFRRLQIALEDIVTSGEHADPVEELAAALEARAADLLEISAELRQSRPAIEAAAEKHLVNELAALECWQRTANRLLAENGRRMTGDRTQPKPS